MSSTAVFASYPFIPQANTLPSEQSPWKIIPTIAPTIIPTKIPGIAGNFNAIATITIIGGKNITRLMLKVSFKLSLYNSTVCISTLLPLYCTKPITKKNISVIAYTTIVDGNICLIWVITSVPAILGARLVVSDNGDILSPK